MTRILVLGVYYADNLGDGIICDCVAAMLREGFPGAQVTICDVSDRHAFGGKQTADLRALARDNRSLRFRRRITRYTPRDVLYKQMAHDIANDRQHIDAVLAGQVDLVVFAGGQMFMDWLSPYVAVYTEGFNEKGVPVLFNACGTGPAYSAAIRKQLARALTLDNVCWVSTRDNAAYINRHYLPQGRTAERTYDPGLWAAQVYGVQAGRNGPVGLGVMFPLGGSIAAAVSFWKRLLRQMESEKRDWRMFTNGDAADYAFGMQILQNTGLSEEKMLPRPGTPRRLVEQIASFSSIISFRLHSHVVAASLGISGVSVVWDDKLRFFFESLGCAERSMGVRTDAAEVLARHDRAAEEGIDASRLDKMKEQARRKLLQQAAIALGEVL